ncbi:MAG: MmgE/PrpD family protein [Deltaproteobacteria bacterium]|nr:MmgE/PrpD family protein [Deltaproteobacteria bacterium]
MKKEGNGNINRTARLVKFIKDLRFEKLPKDVVELTKLLILDLIGVGLFSSIKDSSKIISRFAKESGSQGVCTVFAHSYKTSPQYAALVNATMGHGFEFDDTHDPSVTHPGAVVIPAALALGEKQHINGKHFITSVVAGYEVMGRVGMAVGPMLIERGFHPTSANGPFGAIAAAGKILNLNEKQYLNGFGIVGSMASGIVEFSQDEEGTMIKRLHAGMAAENGVSAALLAKKGFTGPSRVLDGKFGYCRVFSISPVLEKIDGHLGEDFIIRHISVKPYACCRLFHSTLDAIKVMKESKKFNTKQIKTISVGGPKISVAQHMVYEPKSIMAAQYSLPFITAIGMLKDVEDPNVFHDKLIRNKEILGFAKKVSGFEDQELESVFPEKFASKVIIEHVDGTKEEMVVYDSRGTPVKRLTEEEMVIKFKKITKGCFNEKKLKTILEKVMVIEELKDISTLTELLGRK